MGRFQVALKVKQGSNALPIHSRLQVPGGKRYSVDLAYGPNDDLDKKLIEPLLAHVQQGKDACVFLQGPPGSGKTHSLKTLVSLVADSLSTCSFGISFSIAELYRNAWTDLIPKQEGILAHCIMNAFEEGASHRHHDNGHSLGYVAVTFSLLKARLVLVDAGYECIRAIRPGAPITVDLTTFHLHQVVAQLAKRKTRAEGPSLRTLSHSKLTEFVADFLADDICSKSGKRQQNDSRVLFIITVDSAKRAEATLKFASLARKVTFLPTDPHTEALEATIETYAQQQRRVHAFLKTKNLEQEFLEWDENDEAAECPEVRVRVCKCCGISYEQEVAARSPYCGEECQREMRNNSDRLRRVRQKSKRVADRQTNGDTDDEAAPLTSDTDLDFEGEVTDEEKEAMRRYIDYRKTKDRKRKWWCLVDDTVPSPAPWKRFMKPRKTSDA